MKPPYTLKTLIPLSLLSMSILHAQNCTEAYFPFNNAITDESPNANEFTNQGAIFTEDRFNTPNSAAYFPDGPDQIESTDSTFGNFGTSDFSISTWIKTNSTDFERFLGKRENCAPGHYWDIFITEEGMPGFVVNGGSEESRIYIETPRLSMMISGTTYTLSESRMKFESIWTVHSLLQGKM